MEPLVILSVNIFMAVLSYLVTDKIIGSQVVRDSFIKANLFGKDLNKTSEDKV